MNATHSPGPWSFDVRVMSLYIVRDANGKEICAVMPDEAPVIAAAPELLAALERTLSWLTSYKGEGTMGPRGPYEQARAAIAKATGGAK